MAKSQLKPARDKKKPKRDKPDGAKPVSAYQQSITSGAVPSPFGKKR
jgi:hypothetical protein